MKVHELLDAPEKWTKHHSAVNANGHVTATISEDACAWCLFGALARLYPDEYPEMRKRISGRLSMDIAVWNDMPDRTFDQVHALALELDI